MAYRIELRDLPPQYQLQALNQIQSQKAKKLRKDNLAGNSEETSQKTVMKYHSESVTTEDGIKFRSKKEMRRYYELMELLEAGEISDLKLEPQFTLIEGYKKPDGTRVKRMRYTADFSYMQDGELVVEDVKSRPTKTTDYQMRKNMMKDLYNIEITEISTTHPLK